ncbi:MAG: DEAD/DEAH box helicase [Candidatus Ratteibacteria bacterium]|nr:DEAD/DEAH box helicase [Candidatus Ratteibacteria bacterium]
MNQNMQSQNTGFYGLGISPVFLKALEKLKFKEPTPIQRQAMPIAIQGKDVVGIAQTGTGKTIAFGIPMLQRLLQTKGMGLVVVPTRELAIQVDEALHQVGADMRLKTAVLIGGTQIRPQIQALNRNPHIIIATPGRLNDHLQQRTARLSNVHIVVLDEADRMLDMGFEPQIRRIFNVLPHSRQTMLFSATIPHAIMAMATKYMKLPIRIEVAPTGTTVEQVTQEIFIVSKDVKSRLAEKLLKQYHGPTLIFTRTKHGASKLTKVLCHIGHRAAEIHSNRSLNQRREALQGFKSGKYRILVATDVASRGIDVIGIELVINYDLPDNSEDYVHRIGRTARAGASGHAISFVTSDQRRDVQRIERLIRKSLPISPLPAGLPPASAPQFFYGKQQGSPHSHNRSRSGRYHPGSSHSSRFSRNRRHSTGNRPKRFRG